VNYYLKGKGISKSLQILRQRLLRISLCLGTEEISLFIVLRKIE